MTNASRAHGRRDTHAHVIVCGNEKGGSGKSTIAMHVAVALLKRGFRVATVDLDSRQLSFTRYVENRRNWSRSTRRNLEMPHHFHVPKAVRPSTSDAEAVEFALLSGGLEEVEDDHDFVVIDTPGADTYLARLAHMMADTLITPMNDSFIDFDVLARVDPLTHEVLDISQYASAVRAARRQRRSADNALIDWIVVRNRMSPITSRNEQKVDAALRELSLRLGFRIAHGISERVIFREFFPLGLTALDELDNDLLGGRATLSHISARQELRELLAALRLPVDDHGRRRAEARRIWLENSGKPLSVPDIFVE